MYKSIFCKPTYVISSSLLSLLGKFADGMLEKYIHMTHGRVAKKMTKAKSSVFNSLFSAMWVISLH